MRFCAHIFLRIRIKIIMEYNREEAVKYALKWAMSANPEFHHFGDEGGDCTNYVSQCLYAGGAPMNYSANGWYYKSGTVYSESWVGVIALGEFLTRRSDTAGPKGEIVPREEIEVGDIIQLRQNPYYFNHSVIVTKIENGEIYVCAHTYDSLDRPLSSYKFQELRFIHITSV